MSFVDELVSEKQRLQQRLEAIDTLLAAYDGQTAAAAPAVMRGRRKRGRGGRRGAEGSLKDYVRRVLTRKMSVAEVTQAVRDAGYQTSNKTLDKSVGIVLTDLAKKREAKKVERGVYVPR